MKTTRFASPRYVGDPINTVRIFNEKEVDELTLLDIDASRLGREPDYAHVHDIVSEAFMPVMYGGGVRSAREAQRLVSLGVEKVLVNTAALYDPNIVVEIAETLGSSSTVLGVDVKKKRRGGHAIYDRLAGKAVKQDLLDHIGRCVAAGAGEILVNDTIRDGTMSSYDIDLVRSVANSVNVPLIVCGGAGSLKHLREAADAGASAVAVGSMFVYVGKHRAVMINYPPYQQLVELFADA